MKTLHEASNLTPEELFNEFVSSLNTNQKFKLSSEIENIKSIFIVNSSNIDKIKKILSLKARISYILPRLTTSNDSVFKFEENSLFKNSGEIYQDKIEYDYRLYTSLSNTELEYRIKTYGINDVLSCIIGFKVYSKYILKDRQQYFENKLKKYLTIDKNAYFIISANIINDSSSLKIFEELCKAFDSNNFNK